MTIKKMELFHIIDDVKIILRSRGVFKQVPVFRRGTELYAQHGRGGYVRLASRDGGTSAPKVSWIDMDEHPDIDPTGGRFKAPIWTGEDA